MSFQIQKASRSQAKIRMAMYGPSGSGKTYTALSIAKGLVDGGILVIDTERGSSTLYADVFDFDVLQLPDYDPRTYVKALQHVSNLNYELVIVDSLSHAWEGKGGALELADGAARRYGGNKWSGWADVTPIQRALIDTIISSPFHIIATMRAKTDWVIDTNDKGKRTPKKVGLKPIQRDGLEYEFDITAWLDMTHRLFIDKTRYDAIADMVVEKAGPEFGKTLGAWLSGAPVPVFDPPATQKQVKELWARLNAFFETKEHACEWARLYDVELPRTPKEMKEKMPTSKDIVKLETFLVELMAENA